MEKKTVFVPIALADEPAPFNQEVIVTGIKGTPLKTHWLKEQELYVGDADALKKLVSDVYIHGLRNAVSLPFVHRQLTEEQAVAELISSLNLK